MTMTPAEVAALRTAMGLSQDQLADMLSVNVRTVRSWESGRQAVSDGSGAALLGLVERHEQLVDQMLTDGSPVAIARDTPPDATTPRGWHLAAAGRAMLAQPDLTVEWT